VSVYTVSNELSILRHALRIARRRGYLAQIPDFAMPTKPEGRQRYLDADEIKRLLAACATSKNPYLSTIVQFALHLGLRKEELMSLTWERCDLSTGRMTVYMTKSGKPRGIPMNGDVYQILVALEPETDKRVGFLFHRKDRARWGAIRTAFRKALDRAEIKGFRFHDLRHTCGSWLAMNGATLIEIKEILGHADIKTTLRSAHLSPGHLRGAVARLEGLTTPQQTAHKLRIEVKSGSTVA
jgi:integrase